MLHFIPAWYQQNNWCENEQYWYAKRTRSEFDDTVKHIQLFHRSKVHPFQIMLLSYAPNFRHFLHRQSVFRVSYWSCFDAIQEVKRKKVRMFSLHNLNWPKHIEFVYTPFAMVALLQGKKYAQVEFGEDGNPIQVDIYQEGKLARRNIYDDRGFVSSSVVYDAQGPLYQDYLTDKGIWKIRQYIRDGHVEVNPRSNTYLLEYEGEESVRSFSQETYANMSQVIEEVLTAYLSLLDEEDLFCAAMHELHTDILKQTLGDRKLILSFFGDRYDISKHSEDVEMIQNAAYIITDSEANFGKIQKVTGSSIKNMASITPFDSRVDFGISQQLNVQKIMVPVDGLEEERFGQLVQTLGVYLQQNENARVHLFTRQAGYNRRGFLLEKTRTYLRLAGMEEGWAVEEKETGIMENRLDTEDTIPVKFIVEQCVDELAVSKCMREQRIVVDLRKQTEIYLRIAGISVGIPQIIYTESEFVKDGENGFVLQEIQALPGVLEYYLESLNNWNEAMVHAYEIGKKYMTNVLIEKWKEVIDFVGDDSGSTVGK